MLIKRKKRWEISENEVTPHSQYLNRRQFMRAAGISSASALLAACRPAKPEPELGIPQSSVAEPVEAPTAATGEEVAEVTPEPTTPARATTDEFGDPINSYKDITTYNNYYEFTVDKTEVQNLVGDFKTDPWSIEIGGLVNNPGTIDLQDMIAKYDIEERIYRMRCVEAWSMIIPWNGFKLGDLIKDADPKAEAKYVAFETANRPEEMPGLRSRFSPYDWPYKEGLRLDEAMNDLTMLATGIYGEDLLVQNGAPVRLVVPWKYGLKGVKSIVKITLTDEQPPTLWNTAAPREYGFYGNVNPEVSHPRWRQDTERRIGTGRIPTRMFNGYEEEVAALYEGMDLSVNF